MPSCHNSPPKPSPFLALISLGIARRFDPTWVTTDMQDIAGPYGASAQRLSRLVTRAIPTMEASVALLTRRGRPPQGATRRCADQEHALRAALLEVASSVLRLVSLRSPAVQQLIVGAWHRLRKEHPELTQGAFCEALSAPSRTLRSWLRRPRVSGGAPESVVPPPPRRKRPPRRPRFGFDVTVPDTQLAGDTTYLSAFGVPLKLVASQDIGGRDENLFDAILVDDHECAEHVIRVLSETLAAQPGAQAITDQGSPYMAHVTADALDQLQVEHAPQKEADPLGKATIERAFRTVKDIARPILSLTDRLAAAIPSLCNVNVGKAAARIVLTTILRAYQAGARAARRADHARAGCDTDTLARVAAQSREQARAEDQQCSPLPHAHPQYLPPR